MSSAPPVPAVGRFTGIVLGFVVFICVTMIAGTGYLKYQLDRAEAVLAAPDDALTGSRGVFDRLRRDLGYGGFLGLAQKYVLTHDASGVAEMKAHIKSADEIVARLPDETPAETRHELISIVGVYNNAMQKVDTPADAGGGFAAPDLAPLYAALPIFDARVATASAEARLIAQSAAQFWAMLLTLVSWCSLIIAAACAAGIYLTLRDKHSAPMRALAQSIQNMSRGDMRTAIWGTERQDMIGELARAVDIARYHFSHLPDLSLLSDQGPIRMRFEGDTRSLFEAMMKAISEDSENIREHSTSLADAVAQQRESISILSEKVETVLQNILQHGQNGDRQIRQAIHDMLGSAEGLKNAHAHAADQLNRLIPHIQERATGMAEIAQIAGKQIGQTIQALSANELGLKANAEHAKDTLIKLAATADDLGERLFGAINLLQASGKVLAETAEDIKGRFGENPAQAVDLTPLTGRLGEITDKLAALQTRLDQQAEAQAVSTPPAATDSLPERELLSEIEQLITSRLDPKFAAIGQSLAQNGVDSTVKLNTALMELSDRIGALSTAMPGDLHHDFQEGLHRLSTQIDAAALGEKIAALQAGLEKSTAAPSNMEEQITDLQNRLSAQIESSRAAIDKTLRQDVNGKLASVEEAVAATRHAVEAAQSELAKPAPQTTYALPPELQKQLFDQWMQMSTQIEAARASLIEAVSDQIDKMENRLAGRTQPSLSKTAADYAAQRQIEQQTQILSELVATLGVIDAHMQQIKSEMRAATGSTQG